MMEGTGETMDGICGGAVRVVQRAHGYRFSLDPVLLAHFAGEEPPRGPAIDLGTGSAVIPLILARKFGWTPITGLELQPSLYALARRNVEMNSCEGRVSLALGDLRDINRMFPREAFAHVLSNPPYRSRSRGRTNPEEEKAIARHELHCRLDDLARAARWLLRDRGAFHVVYPAERLGELVTALRAERLEPKRVRLVHPRAERPARLVLLTAVKGGAPDVTVLPPLVIHHGHRFTAEVNAMLG
ncbi:MAG TPA: methyltransferase [Myxococcaceae bacterium]|nr:methyltransferase [Myxococcaceae bacterium]